MSKKKKQRGDPMVGCRFPPSMIKELNRLAPMINELPEYKSIKLSQSAMIRLTVDYGTRYLKALLAQRATNEIQIDLLENKKK